MDLIYLFWFQNEDGNFYYSYMCTWMKWICISYRQNICNYQYWYTVFRMESKCELIILHILCSGHFKLYYLFAWKRKNLGWKDTFLKYTKHLFIFHSCFLIQNILHVYILEIFCFNIDKQSIIPWRGDILRSNSMIK